MATSVMVDSIEDARLTRSEQLERAFDAHHERLFRLARRMTGSRDEARELVQETFLRVARRRQPFPAGTISEEAWLVRVLVNACRDQWRRRRVREREGLRHGANQPHNPEGSYVSRLAVAGALARLPPRRRAIVVLHEFEDVGAAEIAAGLGISTVTVRWHLARARRELSKILLDGQVG